jgi:hypothetical protein
VNSNRWSRWLGRGASLGVALIAGCSGSNGPDCYPVRGQVIRDGRPLAEAQVCFHPLDSTPPRVPRPEATTDGLGRYILTTLRSGDGAPAGRYRITVERRAPRRIGEELVRDGANELPARYAEADASPWDFEVQPGQNDVPPLAVEVR